MHHRRATTTGRHRARAREKRGLNSVAFIGSFPAADFRVHPPLPEIAFVGRSNVGKSSLINALVGRRSVAHTSKTPGKTRTCNVYQVNDHFYLVDLPGYGYAKVSHMERRRLLELIRSFLIERATLTGVVWLLDVRRDPSPDDLRVAELFAERGVPVLVAVTKGDKVSPNRQRERSLAIARAVAIPEDQYVVTSARKRQGISELRAAIEALIARSEH